MENDDVILQASFQGIDLKSDVSETSGSIDQPKKEPSVPMFGDPSEYEHMSEEERIAQTEKMMSRHKKWVAEKK